MAKQVFEAFDRGSTIKLIELASKNVEQATKTVGEAFIHSVGNAILYGGNELTSRCWNEHKPFIRLFGAMLSAINGTKLPSNTMVEPKANIFTKKGEVPKAEVILKSGQMEARIGFVHRVTGNENGFFILTGMDRQGNPFETTKEEREEVYESFLTYLYNLWQREGKTEERASDNEATETIKKASFAEIAAKKIDRLIKSLKQDAMKDDPFAVELVKRLESELDYAERARTNTQLAALKEQAASANNEKPAQALH